MSVADNYEQRVKDMNNFMKESTCYIPEFDNDLVRRLAASIKAVSAEKLIIQFRSESSWSRKSDMSKWQAEGEAYGPHRKADMKKETKTQAEIIQKSRNAKRDFCL